jgi:hypothetical protein
MSKRAFQKEHITASYIGAWKSIGTTSLHKINNPHHHGNLQADLQAKAKTNKDKTYLIRAPSTAHVHMIPPSQNHASPVRPVRSAQLSKLIYQAMAMVPMKAE